MGIALEKIKLVSLVNFRGRQEKYTSDDESTGWNSDDELAARVADPSDDESDGERFWGRSEI